MALPTNTFRPKRYFRSKFREGKYLLAAEATDLQLESFEPLREIIKKTYGDMAVGTSFLADQISTTLLRIRPGEAWNDGIPFIMKSGTDAKVIEGILESGITFGESSAGTSDAGGKNLDLSSLADGSYSIVVEATEEIVRPSGAGAVDTYLEGVNVGEETANKSRTIYKIHVVETSDLTENPTYPLSVAGITNHFVNKIVVTPVGGGANDLNSAIDITPDVNGADRRVVFDNSAGELPFANDAEDFINGLLIDSDGNYLTITSITTSDGGATVQMLLDREVDYNSSNPKADLPVITPNVPYTLVKKDFYVTDTSGTPLGKHFYRIADFTFTGGAITSLDDLRTVTEINTFGIDPNVRLVGGGVIEWLASTGDLTFSNNFEITIPGISGKAVISSGTISLTSNGEVAFIYLDREASIDYTETPTVVDKTDVPANVNVYILAERRDDRVYFPHNGSIGSAETGMLGAFGGSIRKDQSLDMIIDSLSENQLDEVFAETFDTQDYVNSSKTSGMTFEPFQKQYRASSSARFVDYFGDVLPTADPEDPWTKLGSQVDSVGGGLLTLTDGSLGDEVAYERTESNLVSESHTDHRFRLRLNSGSGSKQFRYEIQDSVSGKHFGIELVSGQANLIDGTGATLQSYSLDTTLFHTYRLVKIGDIAVQWFIDGVLVGSYKYSDITTAGTDTKVTWGTSIAATAIADIDYVKFTIYRSILQSVDVFRIASVKYEADNIPASDPTEPWTVNGGGGGGITQTIDDSKLEISDGSAADLINFERNESSLEHFGDAQIEMRVNLDSGSFANFEKFGIRIKDGRKDVAAYIRDDAGQLRVGMYNGALFTLVSNEYPIDSDKYVVIKLVKIKDTGYQLYIDGEVKDSNAYEEFTDTTSDKKFYFGGFVVTANYDAIIDYVQYSLPGAGDMAATPVSDFLTIVNSDDPFPIAWISTDGGYTWYESLAQELVSISDLDKAGGNVIARIGLSKSNSVLTDYGVLYNQTNYDVQGQFEYSKLTATAGQTVFVVPWTYEVGSNEIQVFYRPIGTGLTRKLTLPEDYTEVDASRIQLTFAATAGDIIEVRNSFTKDPIVPPPVRFVGHNHSGSKGESDYLQPSAFKMATGAGAGLPFLSDANGDASWGQVDTDGIADDAITNAKIDNNAVDTAEIATGAVTANELDTDAVETVKIKDLNVTRDKLEALGQQISSSSLSWSDNTGGWVDVTNLSVSITTSGRPVMLIIQSDGSGTAGYLGGFTGGLNNDLEVTFRLMRDTTEIARWDYKDFEAGLSAIAAWGTAHNHMDVVGAGTYTYKLQAILVTGAEVRCYNSKIAAYEL